VSRWAIRYCASGGEKPDPIGGSLASRFGNHQRPPGTENTVNPAGKIGRRKPAFPTGGQEFTAFGLIAQGIRLITPSSSDRMLVGSGDDPMAPVVRSADVAAESELGAQELQNRTGRFKRGKPCVVAVYQLAGLPMRWKAAMA